MKTLLLTLSALILLPTTASAKFFRDLQPLDAWIANGGLDFLHHKSDGLCCDTDCEPLLCDEASTCYPAACLYAPNMIGGGNTLLRPFGAGQNAVGFSLHQQHFTRVSENNSAIPRDRISFTHKVLNEVVTYEGGVVTPDQTRDLNEFTLRIEKTHFDGRLSTEFILPWQHTTSSFAETTTNPDEETEMGNLAFGFKYLLHRSENSALSAGMMFEAPTSANIETNFMGTPFTRRAQDAWHITPYLGMFHEHGEALYYHGFLSYRMPTTADGWNFTAGDIRQPNIFMADASVGYWLIKNPHNRFLTGLTTTTELHYSTTTEPHQQVSRFYGQTDHLDLTVGLTAILRNESTIAMGFSFPLRNNSNATVPGLSGPTDRLSDWTFMTQFNVYQW